MTSAWQVGDLGHVSSASLPRGTLCNLSVVGFALVAAVGVGWLWGLGRQLVFSF